MARQSKQKGEMGSDNLSGDIDPASNKVWLFLLMLLEINQVGFFLLQQVCE